MVFRPPEADTMNTFISNLAYKRLPQGTVEFVFGRKMRFVEFREVGHVFVRVYGFLFGQMWSATEFGGKFEGVCGQDLNQFIERRRQKLKTV